MNARPGSRRLQSKTPQVLVVMVLGAMLLGPVLGTLAPVALALGSRNAPLQQGQEPGPRVWIEFPWDGQALPSLPVEILVSSYDKEGVDLVSLRINGEPLPDAQVKARNTGYFGVTLLRQEWMPPGDGEYILEARGRNTAGTYGEPVYAKFCIGSCKAARLPPVVDSADSLVVPTDTPEPGPAYDLYVDRIQYDHGELTIVIATDSSPVGLPLFPGSSFLYRHGPDMSWDVADCSRSYDFAFCRATVPHSMSLPGTYVVEVVADCDEEVTESDETNNYGRQTVVVAAKPSPTAPSAPAAGYDLYVRRMDFMQTNPAAGDRIDLSIMLATDFAPQGAAYYPASHFRWRQGPNFPWQEEVCPDNFQYASCLKDVTFSYAKPGSYAVEVQADSRGTIPETDEANNTKTWTINVGQPVQPTPTQPSEPESEVYFWADPSTIYAGQCATLYWEVSGVQAIYLDGEGVTGSENRTVCPAETTAYNLQVVKEGGVTEDRQAIVTVEGMIESPDYPPEQPPDEGVESPELPPEIPSAQDTSGPSISGVGVSWQDCNVYGYATIVDDSGVGWAQFHFNLDGAGWQSLWMSDRGGGYWEADYPAQASTANGYIEYYVVAGDNFGNESESGAESGTYECGGSEIPQTLNF